MTRAVAPLVAALALGGCGGHANVPGDGPDRDAYVAANEAVFDQLPVFRHARLREQDSTAAQTESGRIIGYTTTFDFDLPQDVQPDEVTAFFQRRLEPMWHLVEKLDGPVLNFRKGRSFVSINLESWRAHVLEVAVDHAFCVSVIEQTPCGASARG